MTNWDEITNWKKVVAQFEAIRRLGQTNMLNKIMVQRIAFENHFYDLVNAITDGYYGKILGNYSKMMESISEKDIPTAYQIQAKWSIDRGGNIPW